MYFSLGGSGCNDGSNPSLDNGADEGTWLSGLNYCDWGTSISDENILWSISFLMVELLAAYAAKYI